MSWVRASPSEKKNTLPANRSQGGSDHLIKAHDNDHGPFI